MALESFANSLLNTIWNHAKKNNEIWIKGNFDGMPEFASFWKEYCGEPGLEKAYWLSLEKKLQLICDELKIPRLSKTNKELWSNLKHLLKDSRNFIVHPKPNQPRFQTHMNRIMIENTAGVYSETAANVILYFIRNIKRTESVPDWIYKNTLLKIHEIEYLGGKIEHPLT